MCPVYLAAPSEDTVILILQRGIESTVLEQTVRTDSFQRLHRHHTTYFKIQTENKSEYH